MSVVECDLFGFLFGRRDLLLEGDLARKFGLRGATLHQILEEGFGPDRTFAGVQGRFYVLKRMVPCFRSWFLKQATDDQIARTVEIITRIEHPSDVPRWRDENDR